MKAGKRFHLQRRGTGLAAPGADCAAGACTSQPQRGPRAAAGVRLKRAHLEEPARRPGQPARAPEARTTRVDRVLTPGRVFPGEQGEAHGQRGTKGRLLGQMQARSGQQRGSRGARAARAERARATPRLSPYLSCCSRSALNNTAAEARRGTAVAGLAAGGRAGSG